MSEENIEITNGVVNDEVATASGKPKKVSLIDEINELRASGQVRTPEFTAKMRELEVLLGVSEISPFGTNELEIFEENIAHMSYTDMQRLANKVGVNYQLERPLLKQVLIKEFTAYSRNSRRNIMPSPVNSFVLDPNNPKHQELKKLLGD